MTRHNFLLLCNEHRTGRNGREAISRKLIIDFFYRLISNTRKAQNCQLGLRNFIYIKTNYPILGETRLDFVD